MMSSQMRFLPLFVTLIQLHKSNADSGYHYNRPNHSPLAQISHPISNSGHHFGPLSTVSPLPPVPALPQLPSDRSRPQFQTQTLVQTHPPPLNTYTASKSIANAYRPPSIAKVQNQYLPPTALPVKNYRSAEVAPNPQFTPGIFGQRLKPLVSATAPVQPQPLRIPFNQQPIVPLAPVTSAGNDIYELGGRKLKQYAVIEIIDNDVEQEMRPFLSSPFVDSYRAQIGASGTGAAPSMPGQQIDSRANALVLEQQRLAQQRATGGRTSTIALGSGGLGFVRLPNGNVYLGSGSLGYVSAEQHMALVQEARTRTGAAMPDALHFGHGPLGNPGNPNGVSTFLF